ncbi:hypothetical protein OG562_44565 [Streptomyces sp. NBC_01275]|uniref:hypothetical protein n=1 Tax=Streptomyces sp. NBC_01275 TaxID=2903807 RepID=UPI0022550182|nr:hypothetical protein [Streptomyces sp. NBC_01275]MCX4767896.1 hypothetical protein [Streptomyces sp. NBC_01275]
MALATVLDQRIHLLSDDEERVTDIAGRSQAGLEHRPGGARESGFLSERGYPSDTVAARFTDAKVTVAEMVTADGGRKALTPAHPHGCLYR